MQSNSSIYGSFIYSPSLSLYRTGKLLFHNTLNLYGPIFFLASIIQSVGCTCNFLFSKKQKLSAFLYNGTNFLCRLRGVAIFGISHIVAYLSFKFRTGDKMHSHFRMQNATHVLLDLFLMCMFKSFQKGFCLFFVCEDTSPSSKKVSSRHLSPFLNSNL